jgi:radical SAM-linked protein
MFRRAGLPVGSTKGFNPRPRVWFAQSLALGVVGRREVLELELTAPLPEEELHRRLAERCPPGLAIHSVRAIDARAAARVRRAHFRLPLAEPIPDLAERCAALLAREHHWIERTRPHRRRLDLRPFIAALSPADRGLEMALWVSPYGAARPEEVIEALGLQTLLEVGAVLERTDLELADECPDAEPPPTGLPARPTTEEPNPQEQGDRTGDRATAPRPTAIITGPLSFDT